MKLENELTARTEMALRAAGGLSLCAGLLIVFCFHTQQSHLIQIKPNLAPVSYDSGIGFGIIGIGLLSLAWRMRWLVLMSGTGVISLALWDLFRFRPPVGQVLMPFDTFSAAAEVIRFYPSMAVSVLITGCALAMMSHFLRWKWRPALIGVLGAITLAVGIFALIGHATQMPSSFGWGNVTQMSLLGAMALTMISLSILSFAWDEGRSSENRVPDWIPLPIGASVLTVTLCLWQTLRVDTHSPFPELTFASGLAIAFLLPLATHLARKAYGKAQAWERVTAELRKEMIKRQRIEETLRVSEEALRENQGRFQIALKSSPIVLSQQDRNLRYTWIHNPHGPFTAEEIPGKSDFDLVSPAEAQTLTNIKKGVLETQVPARQEVQVTYGTQTHWYDLLVEPVRGNNDEILGVTCAAVDITQRKKAEEQVCAYQDKLQSLTSELFLSEERERRRIATNLHDQIGQTLAFAKLKMKALRQWATAAGLEHLLDEVKALLEQAISDTRSLTFELSPPVLYELGLVAAIEWLARKTQQEHGIITRFHDDGQSKPLEEDFRVVLFQVVRELLINVVKHAQAKHVNVLIRRDGDALRIVVEDDGIGFDPLEKQSDAVASTAFGLFNIRERLNYLGGRMKIRSERGYGTRITLLAPLNLKQTVT